MIGNEVLEMSKKERDRLVILKQVDSGVMTQVKAAELLSLTSRQVRNLLASLRKHGDAGIISKKRGKPGNHRKPPELKALILDLVKENYPGFGPTLASEKLAERDGVEVCVETLRLWMHAENLLPKKDKKKKKLHKPRMRRECFGELIQVDGSHHRWFGPEGDMVNLTVFIDDATGTVTGLYISKGESLEAYYKTLEQHLVRYGRPMALYADHSAVCEVRRGDSITQFHKALEMLDIELILANSAQAKGRVERVNRTFQDRLIKELFLRGIKTIEEANQFFEEYLKSHNERFAKEPMSEADAHRPLHGFDLSIILREHKQRTLQKCGIFQYDNEYYEVQGLAATRDHKGRKVDLYLEFDGSFRVFLEGVEKSVVRSPVSPIPMRPKSMGRKEITAKKDLRKPRFPVRRMGRCGPVHPWKRWSGPPRRPQNQVP